MCLGMLLAQVNINMLYVFLDKQSGLGFFPMGFMQITTIKDFIARKNMGQKRNVLFVYLLFLKVPLPLSAPKMYYRAMTGLQWLVHEGQTRFSLLLLCSNGE